MGSGQPDGAGRCPWPLSRGVRRSSTRQTVLLALSCVLLASAAIAQPPGGAIVVRPQKPAATDVNPVDAKIEEVKEQFPPGAAKVGQNKGFGTDDFDWPWLGLYTKTNYSTFMLLHNKCTSAKQVQVLISSSLQPYLGLATAEVGYMDSKNQFAPLEGKELVVNKGPGNELAVGVDAVTTLQLKFVVHTPDHLDLPPPPPLPDQVANTPGNFLQRQGFDGAGSLVWSPDGFEFYPVFDGNNTINRRVEIGRFLPIKGLVLIQALNPGSDCVGNPMLLRTGGRLYERQEEPPPPPPESGSWDCTKWWEETRVPPPTMNCTVEFRVLALDYVQRIRPTDGILAGEWHWLPSDQEIGGMSAVQLIEMKRRADIQLLQAR